MRNIILILILAIASVNLSAQEKITIKKGEKIKEIKKGAYYEKSTESLEKFTGEWISKETNFKIILSIEKIFFKGPDIYMDALVGKYSYNSSEIDDKEFSFKTTSTTGENGKTASFLFQDKEKNKNGDLHLKILDRDKMKWTLKIRKVLDLVNSTKPFQCLSMSCSQKWNENFLNSTILL